MIRWRTRPRRPGETFVILEGDLTEGGALDGLEPADAEVVVLNLARVRYLNSEGTAELVRFVERLHGSGRIVAELCSPAVVAVLNFVPILALYMQVQSVLMPFECAACDVESDVPVTIPIGAAPKLPPAACAGCARPLQPAVAVDRYFAFLVEP